MNSAVYSFFTGMNSSVEKILLLSISTLVFLVILLIFYAILLRISSYREKLYKETRLNQWEKLILVYIDGESIKPSRFRLKKKDWLFFGEFISQYLDNLRGEDHDRLIDLLRDLKYERFLMKAVRTRNKWKRVYAIQLLGKIKSVNSRSLLMEMLKNPSHLVAISAFDALQLIGEIEKFDSMVKTIIERSDLSYPIVSEIIFRFSDETNPVLIKMLEDKAMSDKGKRLIVDILAKKRVSAAIPVIINVLETCNDDELIIGCIKALGVLEAPDALPVVYKFLSSSNWIIRSQAVKALGMVGTDRDIPELMEMLRKDQNFWVMTYGVQSLISMGEKGKDAVNQLRCEMLARQDIEDIIEFALNDEENKYECNMTGISGNSDIKSNRT